MCSQAPLLREVPPTLTEKGARLFAVVLLGMSGHAVVARYGLSALVAIVDLMLIAGVIHTRLVVVELHPTLGAADEGFGGCRWGVVKGSHGSWWGRSDKLSCLIPQLVDTNCLMLFQVPLLELSCVQPQRIHLLLRSLGLQSLYILNHTVLMCRCSWWCFYLRSHGQSP